MPITKLPPTTDRNELNIIATNNN